MENLGLDYKLLIAQVLNFVVFFYIFKKYISKPFFEFLKNEKKLEEEKNELLLKMQKKEEEIKGMEIKQKQELKKEKDVYIKEAKESAEKIKQEIVTQAEKEAESTREKSKKQIEEERKDLYVEVRDKTAELSLFLIKKGLDRYLTEDMRKKLTEYILKNSSKDIEVV